MAAVTGRRVWSGPGLLFFIFPFSSLGCHSSVFLPPLFLMKIQVSFLSLLYCVWWVIFSGCFENFLFIVAFQQCDCNGPRFTFLCILLFRGLNSGSYVCWAHILPLSHTLACEFIHFFFFVSNCLIEIFKFICMAFCFTYTEPIFENSIFKGVSTSEKKSETNFVKYLITELEIFKNTYCSFERLNEVLATAVGVS